MSGLVIFDLDDTLVRTAAATRAARRTVLAALFPGWDDKQVRAGLDVWRRTTMLYPDRLFTDLIRVVGSLTGTPLPAGADLPALAAGYRAEQVERITAEPRVVAAARRLRADGHALAIVSNGDDEAQRAKIERCGLGDLAPAGRVVVCDGVRIPRKPDPQALRQVAGDADRAVLIGDRTSDVLAGRLAGLPVIRLRARTADLERASGLRRLVRADAECSAADLYRVASDLL